MVNPSILGGALTASRIGHTKTSTLTNRALLAKTQSTLFKEGITKSELNELLTGNFNALSPKRIEEIAKIINKLSTVAATSHKPVATLLTSQKIT